MMKNVNELQRIMNCKLDLFSQRYTESELFSLYLEYKPLNQKQFHQCAARLFTLYQKSVFGLTGAESK